MNKQIRRWPLVLGSAMLAAAAASLAVPLVYKPIRSVDPAALRPSGVIGDPSANAIFLMNPEGGIDAISPASGELLWSSNEAARPLAVWGDQLVAQGQPGAQAGVLDAVLLDARTGVRRQTLSVALPEGVWEAVDQGMNTTFEARAVVLGGEAYLLWDHTRRFVKGIASKPGEDLEQNVAGASRLDPIAGRTIAVDPATLELEATLPPAVRQWVDSGELSNRPAPAGQLLAATQAVGEQIVLKRWNRSGESLPDVDLFSGPYILELRSADGRHLLVGERVAPGEREEYGWSIFSLETGQRLGQVRNHSSHAWFFVHGATLIHIARPVVRRVNDELVTEPLRIRGVGLDSGAVSWERPLRDTSYRGPFPP